MKIKLCLFIAAFLLSCNTPKEYVLPFINFGYSGERLFPVSENDGDFSFRVWFSASSSIDRVFTISNSKDFGYTGKLLEIRGHSLNNKIDKTSFKESNIIPKCGFEQFISKVDSLNLLDLRSQDPNNFLSALHEPFSLFVVEIKSHGRFNHFKFHTHIVGDHRTPVENQYQRVEDLVLKELPFNFYFQKK